MAAADIEKANQGRPETVPDPKAPKPPNPALDKAINQPSKPGNPITRYNAAEYLNSEESRAEYLRAALETKDEAFILDSIGVLARAMSYDWQPLPPVGEKVMAMRDGEWLGATGVWTGSHWESRTAPIWYRDMDVLMPMKVPTHWKLL